ncbi:FixH family protein [Paraglaciecola sp. L3A3]|uniref:FixH family protein n=1 Tax=Paraglaciecola sp. L3A3 TaxID=2686358 RepID=UPI00131B2EBA|nr:FixH family protein [Paraglaciecola sp. L3A3]
MQTSNSIIWYKQFWPWFLIIVPLTSMVLSFTMMYLAFTTEDSMVIDDYYKEGKAINVKIKAIQKAKELNIVSQLVINNNKIELSFVSGLPEDDSALVMDFHHATQDFKDFSVTLFKDAKGIYRAPHDYDVAGKWRISLHPFNDDWKIQQMVSLPRQQTFEFKP